LKFLQLTDLMVILVDLTIELLFCKRIKVVPYCMSPNFLYFLFYFPHKNFSFAKYTYRLYFSEILSKVQ